MQKALFVIVILIISNTSIYCQIQIKGKVIDESDSSGVPFSSVVVYGWQSNNIKAYTTADENGNFLINVGKIPIVTLEIRQLGYFPFKRDIALLDSGTTKLMLEVPLKPKVQEMEELVITDQAPPIIIKEDTIIYNIKSFQSMHDQSLENVLLKIPGFEIRANGDILVNNTLVNKVLVDGEEISNAGGTILTKTLSPDNVKSVEVRFDEKNNKLKESLLDADKYVVLDIKLNNDFNKSLFGKVRLTQGFQDRYNPGGYLNAFSLKKKFKNQVFAESDQFGEEIISLEFIKNIGKEAVQKMFDTPSDFTDYVESPAIEDEIYGFPHYTRNARHMAGISSKYTLNEKIDFYFGSFSEYLSKEQENQVDQIFNGGTRFNYREQIADESFISKNKIEVRYDTDKTKIRLDANAIFNYSFFNSINNDNINFYQYEDQNTQIDFYNNLFFERKINETVGFSIKTSYSSINADISKLLTHNDSTYSNFSWSNSENGSLFSLTQNIQSKEKTWFNDLFIKKSKKANEYKLGFKYMNRRLNLDKSAISENTDSFELFSASNPTLVFHKFTPYLSHEYFKKAIVFKNKIAYTYLSWPINSDSEVNNSGFLEYDFNFNYNPGNYNHLIIEITRKLDTYPLYKIAQGYDLQSFQQIAIPGINDFTPVPSYVIDLTSGINFESINMRIDPGILYGRSYIGDQYNFGNSIVIQRIYDQLMSDYISSGLIIHKSFDKLPVEIIVEPEYLINRVQNKMADGSAVYSMATLPSLGIKFDTDFENKDFFFRLFPKFSAVITRNDLIPGVIRTYMSSLAAEASFPLYKSIGFSSGIKGVSFSGESEANYVNLNFKLSQSNKSFYWFLQGGNLLNDTLFIRQTSQSLFFINQAASVFGRYFKVGVEFKIK
ncbi:MAG: hypothetical protein ACOCWM_01975 [Cyclobacteriaceae bacterium]